MMHAMPAAGGSSLQTGSDPSGPGIGRGRPPMSYRESVMDGKHRFGTAVICDGGGVGGDGGHTKKDPGYASDSKCIAQVGSRMVETPGHGGRWTARVAQCPSIRRTVRSLKSLCAVRGCVEGVVCSEGDPERLSDEYQGMACLLLTGHSWIVTRICCCFGLPLQLLPPTPAFPS